MGYAGINKNKGLRNNEYAIKRFFDMDIRNYYV
jgi:hypothetical protein